MIHRIKREKDMLKNVWNGIGGKVKESESPEECVIREVFEESGLKIQNPLLKGILTFPNNRNTGETWYVFVYTTTEFTGELQENDEGELEWISVKSILQGKQNIHVQNADKYFIKWLDKKKIFSAKFDYEDEQITDYSVVFY